MHIENGMWLLMPVPVPQRQKPPANLVPQVVRLSTIPHGNSLVAVGGATAGDGGPTIPSNITVSTLAKQA